MDFPYRGLMVQGTTSDAGKSTLVAALCRLLHRQGISVAPFKPQNMALNSAVTVDGGEIGRAQALQAQACGLAPHTDMNPVLLKPSSDTGAQIIVHGQVRGDMQARDYDQYKTVAMGAVRASWQRLQAQYACVIVEGAGSPAEINLRARDIANMGFAEDQDCPVILIADIDRGGVFAHFIGTLACLSASEQARIIGFVINRFRGDISLLQGGIDWLQEKTGKPVLGVLPYLHGLQLDAEDAVQTSQNAGSFKVVVPVLPRIANHTDFDALRLHPQVDLQFIGPGQNLPAADLIILPGSKNTCADLAWLRAQGWDQALLRHLRYGGKLIGICGGFQMLGQSIADPHGVEGAPGSRMPGLGLLEMETELRAHKQLRQVAGTCRFAPARVSGYEIHMGVSYGQACANPAFWLEDGPSLRAEGAIAGDGQILGTYLHGLFDHPEAGAALLTWAGLRQARRLDLAQMREQSLDRIADAAAPVLQALQALPPNRWTSERM